MSDPVRPSVRVCIRTDEGAQHCGVPIPEAELASPTPGEPPAVPVAGVVPGEPLAQKEEPPG